MTEESKVRICGMAPPREAPKLPDRMILPPNPPPFTEGFVDGFNSCLVLVKRTLAAAGDD